MDYRALIPGKLWLRILGGLLLLSLALGTGRAAAQPQSPDERQIRELVERMTQGFLKRDMNALMAAATDDAELVVQGLAGAMRHKGKEKIRAAYAAQLKTLHSPSLSMLGLEVKVRETMAQATLEIMAGGYWGQEQVAMPARLSALLEKRGGKWAVYYAQFRYPLLRPEFDQLLGR